MKIDASGNLTVKMRQWRELTVSGNASFAGDVITRLVIMFRGIIFGVTASATTHGYIWYGASECKLCSNVYIVGAPHAILAIRRPWVPRLILERRQLVNW